MALALATLMLGGCSHGALTEVPAAPTPTPLPVTVKRLIITPTGGATLIPGRTIPITSSGPLPSGGALGALAEFTDNSRQYIEATWTSSDPRVIVVADSTVRAVGPGTATLTATAQGHTTTETFTVEPGIPGTWAGTFVADQCSANSGSMEELICGSLPGRPRGMVPVGVPAPISFVITQSGKDLTAAAAIGDVRGTLSGIDRGENFLSLLGELAIDRTFVKFFHWDTRVKIDAMEGFIGFEVRMGGVPGIAQVSGHLVDVTRR
jgi:hypothetical protein